MQRLPLEDTYLDILNKAQRGLGISDPVLCQAAGIKATELAELRTGDPSAATVAKLARCLGLSPSALIEGLESRWYPHAPEVAGLRQLTSAHGDMMVNSYVCWDPESREAVVFDTGGDSTAMIDFMAAERLFPRLVLLTHSHSDHVADLPRLLAVTGAKAWVNRREPVAGAADFTEGKEFSIGPITVQTLLTSGHSPGGTTYVIRLPDQTVAVVGDSIFAGSMGGSMGAYAEALANNREKILQLPANVVLCPGHGPLTTVGEEATHNPFFAP